MIVSDNMSGKPLSGFPSVDGLRLNLKILFLLLELSGGCEALWVVSDMHCNLGEVFPYSCVVELNLEPEIIESIDYY